MQIVLDQSIFRSETCSQQFMQQSYVMQSAAIDSAFSTACVYLECASEPVLVKSNKVKQGAVNEPLLLQLWLQLCSESIATDIGCSPSRMAFKFSQTCQLPSLSVWHNLQPNSGNALLYGYMSQRRLSGKHRQRRILSSHAMSCRAVSVESRGDKGCPVFQHFRQGRT